MATGTLRSGTWRESARTMAGPGPRHWLSPMMARAPTSDIPRLWNCRTAILSLYGMSGRKIRRARCCARRIGRSYCNRTGLPAVGRSRAILPAASMQNLQRPIRSARIEDSHFDISNFLVIHKKLFNLFQHCRIELGEILDLGIEQRRLRHRDQAVIAFHLACFFLLELDNADQQTIYQTTGKERVVSEDQNIQRIPVWGFGGGHEPEIVRKDHACRHY